MNNRQKLHEAIKSLVSARYEELDYTITFDVTIETSDDFSDKATITFSKKDVENDPGIFRILESLEYHSKGTKNEDDNH